MVNMLDSFMNRDVEETKQTLINRIVCSTLQRHLKTFLDTAWVDGHQLIVFRHPSLEQVCIYMMFVFHDII